MTEMTPAEAVYFAAAALPDSDPTRDLLQPAKHFLDLLSTLLTQSESVARLSGFHPLSGLHAGTLRAVRQFPKGKVECRERLGGLLKHYSRAAA